MYGNLFSMYMYVCVYFSGLEMKIVRVQYTKQELCFKDPPLVAISHMSHMFIVAEEQRQGFANYILYCTDSFCQNVI